jgi:hypothetical protein
LTADYADFRGFKKPIRNQGGTINFIIKAEKLAHVVAAAVSGGRNPEFFMTSSDSFVSGKSVLIRAIRG